MDNLKYIRLENQDGSYSEPIPLAVDGDYVYLNNEVLTNIIADIISRLENLEQQQGSI